MSEKQGNFEALLEKPIEWEFNGEIFFVPSLGVDGLRMLIKLFKKLPQEIVLKVKAGIQLSDEDVERVKEFESEDNTAMFDLVEKTLELMFPDNYANVLKNLKSTAFLSLFNAVIDVNNISALSEIKEQTDFQRPQPSKSFSEAMKTG